MKDRELHIVADRDIPFLQGVLEPYARVDYLPGDAITAQNVRDADVLLVRTRTRCDAALLDSSRVSLVATATIGFDHIDLAWCADHDIEVITAAGSNARGVLQYVMAALARLAETDGWEPGQKTLGVIGVGNVGLLVAQYGKLFGFRVVCCDPPKQRENPALSYLILGDLLSQSDIVSLHVPFTASGPDTTAGLAGVEFFSKLKPGATFINTSRGGVMNDMALTAALKDGYVVRSVIDTWNGEPHLNPELLATASYATPHIAGYSLQGKAAATAAVVRAVAGQFGLPLTEWYPPQVAPTVPNETIGWEEMKARMPRYFNIEAESTALKAHPEDFEAMRNQYAYRTEFF